MNALRTRTRIALGAMVGSVLLAGAAPALASRQSETPVAAPSANTAVAKFGNTTLNLRQGWGGAQSCAVLPSLEVRCFRSNAEADSYLVGTGHASAIPPPPDSPSGGFSTTATPPCATGWLCLYEHNNGGGRRLIFSSEYCHDLRAFGFQGKTSSWRNNQGSSDWGRLSGSTDCRSYIALAPRAYASSMGAYNDWAYSVYG